MRPQVILGVTLAVLTVLAAEMPLGKGNKEEAGAAVATDAAGAGASSWPCCDDCSYCLRMNPPKCRCDDISLHGCRPECKKCVRYTLTADDDGIEMPATSTAGRPGPVRTYRCEDLLTNFCERRCTPAPAAVFLGEVF